MLTDRFITRSLRDPRVTRIMNAALLAVEPASLVHRFLENYQLPRHSRCFLLGLGKAAEAMTRGAAERIDSFEAALAITKHMTSKSADRITILEAGHPIPDARSIAAGQAALDFVSRLEPQDLLVCLISGGGSSLATAPVQGVSLRQIQTLTADALASGADIGEINNLRRCLDRIKGGGLALATKAQVLGLVLSDVIGDRIESVASGPTVPSQSEPERAAALLERLRSLESAQLRQYLNSSPSHDTLGESDRVRNVIIGNAGTAARGALEQARREGIIANIEEAPFEGEARHVGRGLGRRLGIEAQSKRRPQCLIAVGESTVTLGAAPGLGGRNQELALAAVESLAALEDCMLVALSTDGEDGPTAAAGAVVTGKTASRAQGMGMRTDDYLDRHDAYRYFDALGDLLRPGYTGTNVNDIVFLFAL